MKLILGIVFISTSFVLQAQPDINKDTLIFPATHLPDNNLPVNTADSIKKMSIKNITLAKDYLIYSSNGSFLEKCRYYITWFKKEYPFIFWPLLIMACLWLIKMVLKLLER